MVSAIETGQVELCDLHTAERDTPVAIVTVPQTVVYEMPRHGLCSDFGRLLSACSFVFWRLGRSLKHLLETIQFMASEQRVRLLPAL